LLFSRIFISIGFFVVLFNWVFEGGFKEKYNLLKINFDKIFISLVLLLYIAGLIHTNNISNGLAVIKIKLPLLLPVFFVSAIKLSKNKLDIVLHFFIASVFTSTLFAFFKFQLFNNNLSLEDIYNISLVGLNLHLSLLVNFAICLVLYFIFLSKNKLFSYNIIYSIILIWLLLFLYLLNSLTGYFVFAIILMFNLILLLFKTNKLILKILSTFFIILFITIPLIFIFSEINSYYKVNNVNLLKLEKQTELGNLYKHNIKSKRIENGNYIDIYICEQELKKEWNKLSDIKYKQKDNKEQQLSETLIRYLSSKGLKKDSVGISKLSKKEIAFIENGCANYLYINKYSAKSRLHHIIWQLDMYITTGNATGQSVSQRIEFFKSAIFLIKNNFWFGVGSGDLMDTSKEELAKFSKLEEGYRNRVHNQFLAVFAGLGVVGFSFFLFLLFYPIIKNKKYKDYLFINFIIIILVSFFAVNTLETQLGVSFFSLFYSILFFNNRQVADE